MFFCNDQGSTQKPMLLQDASWMLTSNAPLRCTSPADVYLLLKSPGFAIHDLDDASIFEGCVDEVHSTNRISNGQTNGSGVETSSVSSDQNENDGGHKLELVLKKWYEVERSGEIGVSSEIIVYSVRASVTVVGMLLTTGVLALSSYMLTGSELL
jgi:hypothetical protein